MVTGVRQRARLKSLFRQPTTGETPDRVGRQGMPARLLDPVAAGGRPYEIRVRLEWFYTCAAAADIP